MNNNRFFKKINRNIGVEAYEEFKESDTMGKLKELDNKNVNLELMADVIHYMIDNVDDLKFLSSLDSKNLAIENMVLRYCISKNESNIIDDAEIITHLISDAVVDLLENGE